MLSHVGPDWGFCVAAPPTDGKDWLPQVLLVVRVVRGDDAAPVDEALLSAVEFTARWAVLSYNHDHPGDPLSLKSVEYNHQEIHYLVGDRILPPGFQPAYGLASGWLVFGQRRRRGPRLRQRQAENAARRRLDVSALASCR